MLVENSERKLEGVPERKIERFHCETLEDFLEFFMIYLGRSFLIKPKGIFSKLSGEILEIIFRENLEKFFKEAS